MKNEIHKIGYIVEYKITFNIHIEYNIKKKTI